MRVAKLACALVLSACAAAGPASTPPPGAAIVTAAGETFTTPAVTASARASFTIFFEITNSSQHDLRLWNGATSIGATEIFGGPAARTLAVSALDPGEYRITCDIHPSMLGMLTAE